MTTSRCLITVVLAVLLVSVNVSAVERSDLMPLPLPDLGNMGNAARGRLEQLQDRITDLNTSASDAELAEAYGTLGMYYIAHHLNDAAEIAFGNAALLAPRDFRWAYYRGFVYQMVGKLGLEREEFERALELRPDDVPTHLRLAELHLALGEHEEAYRRFQLAVELSPNEAAAHSGMGRAAAALERPEEAVEHFEKALELRPQGTIVHYQLALAYRSLGDMEAARTHLAQRGDAEMAFADPLMSAIEPLKKEDVLEAVLEMANAPEEHDNRSIAIYSRSYLAELPGAVDQLHDAIDALTEETADLEQGSEQAERNRLTRARLHFATASVFLENEDLGGVRSEIEAALTLQPNMVGAILMLGYVFEQERDLTRAIERYSAVLELDPDNTYALRSRANARFQLRHDRAAITDLEHLCELGSERDGVRIRLAVAYLRLGDIEAARENYRKALALNLEPSDAAQAHHHLGIIEMRRGSTEQAVEEYHTALALDPHLTAARLDLGLALDRLGRHQEAIEAFRLVVEADPRSSRARRGEAEALEALGRSQEARQRLEEGWREIPDSVELLHALARLLASAGDPKVRDGERALDLSRRTLRAGSTPSRLETLAMASAEAGRFTEAVELQREVIQTMRRQGRADLIPRLEANLARYQNGQSCCAQ